jgi:hypothetical protein
MGGTTYEDVGAQALSDAGGGRSAGVGEPTAAFEPVPYSAFGHPFAGWLALSDMIADSNPELGDAMRAFALVLRAAIEQSVADRFEEVRRLLLEAGIPRWPVDNAERALLSGILPLSVKDLAEEAGQAYAELRDTGTMRITEPPSVGFMASVVHYGAPAILGIKVDQDVPPLLPVLRKEDLPEALRDHYLPPTPFRVAASLDMPAVVNRENQQAFSIWCRKPLRSRGDNLEATEHTYIEREVDGLTNPRFRGTGDAVTSLYRPDIEKWLPADFTESVDQGCEVHNYYYVYELNDPKRSRAIKRLRKMLDYQAVHSALQLAVTGGVAVGVAATGPVGPVLAPAVALADPMARVLADGLVGHLQEALSDTSMTPWSITHTTFYGPQYPVGPLSMFMLLSPTEPKAKLHRIVRDKYDQDRSEMNLDYGGVKVRAQQRGRGMVGLTVPPDRRCPSDLWQQVAVKNQPAAWTEPDQDRGGFRVLVPHAEAGKDASYVSALRADVVLAEERTPSKAKRFTF